MKNQVPQDIMPEMLQIVKFATNAADQYSIAISEIYRLKAVVETLTKENEELKAQKGKKK